MTTSEASRQPSHTHGYALSSKREKATGMQPNSKSSAIERRKGLSPPGSRQKVDCAFRNVRSGVYLRNAHVDDGAGTLMEGLYSLRLNEGAPQLRRMACRTLMSPCWVPPRKSMNMRLGFELAQGGPTFSAIALRSSDA